MCLCSKTSVLCCCVVRFCGVEKRKQWSVGRVLWKRPFRIHWRMCFLLFGQQIRLVNRNCCNRDGVKNLLAALLLDRIIYSFTPRHASLARDHTFNLNNEQCVSFVFRVLENYCIWKEIKMEKKERLKFFISHCNVLSLGSLCLVLSKNIKEHYWTCSTGPRRSSLVGYLY